MRSTRATLFAVALVLLGGCAAAGLTPVTPTQPIARAQMRPEYRVFYDALKDFGEWVLIEPLGWVFRPDVAYNIWQPYSDGFWAPTDAYGWVWISAEPFGWATDHYGQWLYDRFQGWVWTPGLDWAPAWVTWTISGDYAGWSPLPPGGDAARLNSLAPIPPAAVHFAPLAQLGSTDLAARTVTATQARGMAEEAKPVKNLAERDGVTFNRGPSLAEVERRGGPLSRARIEDLVPANLGRLAAEPAGKAPAGKAPARPDDDPIVVTKRAAERAAADARRLTGASGPSPSWLLMVRPVLGPPKPAGPAARPRAGAGASPAPADTTR
jgi:hypothetical protein